MKWETVKIKQSNRGKTTPFASVGRGQLDFSAAACELLGESDKYSYAQFVKGEIDGKLCVGVRFLTQYEEDSIRITRKVQDGKPISGMTVRNKEIVEDLFGAKGIHNGMVRHSVKLDFDEPNILIVSLD